MSATQSRNTVDNIGASSLVGVIDSIIQKTTNVSWEWNKIGGLPDWMRSKTTHPTCHACQRLLTLVAQLYCPLEGSPYHRTVYVFTCLTNQCLQNSLSFRIFRAQKLVDTTQCILPQPASLQTSPDPMTFDTDWCDDCNDWGDNANEWGDGDSNDGNVDGLDDVMQDLGLPQQTSYSAVLASGHKSSGKTDDDPSQTVIQNSIPESRGLEHTMEQLTLDATTPERSPEASNSDGTSAVPETGDLSSGISEDIPELASYFINVFEEPQPSAEEKLSHELRLFKEYQQREGVSLAEWQETAELNGPGGGGAGKEGYEKSTAKHGDRVFQKFSKKIQLCPQQCVRYSYNGTPLWLTAPTEAQSSIPRCHYCGSHRQYEFQLMPALVPHLQLVDKQGISIEFGVVVVYTCSQSCWNTDSAEFYREEVATVQQDPDSAAINQAQKQIQRT